MWDSLWDLLWDSSGIHETCVGPHVTRDMLVDTHVGLVDRGWLDHLVFSLVFNLACSSTLTLKTYFSAALTCVTFSW